MAVTGLGAALASPAPVWACSACVDWGFPQRTLDAYVLTTAILAVMPLVIAGSLLGLYLRRSRRQR